MNHWELLRITSKKFQSGLWITMNGPKEISEWFMNHWKLPERNFRVVCKSLRITPKKFQFFVNHWESLRIIKDCPKKFQSGLWISDNHWESPQRNFRVVCKSPRITPKKFQSGLWITKNHPQRNFRVICKSLRITPMKFQSLADHWESPQTNFRVYCESLIIAENHQELPQRNFRVVSKSLRITPKKF